MVGEEVKLLWFQKKSVRKNLKTKSEIKRLQRPGPLWKLSVELGFHEALVLIKESS